MIDLTIGDPTQRQILPHLLRTEALLAKAASVLSHRQCDAEITALPDLGLPHNTQRILGGFFTGACYAWDTDVPFVPVDATVNVDGVGVYRLEHGFETEREFFEAIERARLSIAQSSFVWNYGAGNHFISSGTVPDTGQGQYLLPGSYLILHASPAEYARQYNGLYLTDNNWYADNVSVIASDHDSARYIRILAGVKAERFFRWAQLLEGIFHERQEFIAALVAGNQRIKRCMSVLHYGMPAANAVAIGCQWLSPHEPVFLFLTGPGYPLLLVEALPGGLNRRVFSGRVGDSLLTPHGLGSRLRNERDEILLRSDGLQIGDSVLNRAESLKDTGLVVIRDFAGVATIERVLETCPGRVVGTVIPDYSYYRGHTGGPDY